jgi:1-acyl-sn-glycerol-3-phosphate acyltransferase
LADIKARERPPLQDLPARSYFKRLFRFLIKVLTRLQVEGLENVPAEGGLLLATNHLSVVDPVLVSALVAKNHQKNPIFRAVIDAVGGIWINREEADARAFRTARAHLQSGGALGIAPEGTRSQTGALIPPKTGAAYLADKAGVPVIPVAITGTEETFAKLRSFRRPRITLRFGRPFTLPPVTRQARDADLQRNTDEIMSQIATLLPSAYRGVYAGHPRLLELEAGGKPSTT